MLLKLAKLIWHKLLFVCKHTGYHRRCMKPSMHDTQTTILFLLSCLLACGILLSALTLTSNPNIMIFFVAGSQTTRSHPQCLRQTRQEMQKHHAKIAEPRLNLRGSQQLDYSAPYNTWFSLSRLHRILSFQPQWLPGPAGQASLFQAPCGTYLYYTRPQESLSLPLAWILTQRRSAIIQQMVASPQWPVSQEHRPII